MTRRPVVLIGACIGVAVAAVVAFGLLGGGEQGPGFADIAGETEFEWDFVIPSGTADRIADGEPIEIIPSDLTVHIGEAIRIVNHDEVGHNVGVFYVGPGETFSKRFTSPGALEGECTVHHDRRFTLRVEA